jgi:hypothetical protein
VSILKLPVIFLLSVGMLSCSQSSTVNEEELLKILVQVNQVGPLNFRRDVWPTLKDKTITYCGQIQEAKTSEANTILLMKVDKQSVGESLPWSLEGKSSAPEVASSYKPGDPLCMTGVIEGFTQVQEGVYWGHVKILSLAKPS